MPLGSAIEGGGSGASIGASTGNPVAAAIGAIVGFLAGLFGGGVPRAIKRAFEGVRAALAATAENLLHFTWRGLRALGAVLRAALGSWVRILRPLLNWAVRQLGRLRRLYERILRPYLRAIDAIRRKILEIYERHVRPIIVMIERLRRVLFVLRLARLKFAERLDRVLADVERRLLEPIYVALSKINELSGWLNVILRADVLLQADVLLGSVDEYVDDITAIFVHRFTGGETADQVIARFPRADPAAATRAREEVREVIVMGTGPLRTPVEQMLAEAREMLRAA